MGRYKVNSDRSRKRSKNAPIHVGRLRLDATPSQDRIVLLRERACDRIYNEDYDDPTDWWSVPFV